VRQARVFAQVREGRAGHRQGPEGALAAYMVAVTIDRIRLVVVAPHPPLTFPLLGGVLPELGIQDLELLPGFLAQPVVEVSVNGHPANLLAQVQGIDLLPESSFLRRWVNRAKGSPNGGYAAQWFVSTVASLRGEWDVRTTA
jgi:hypothetical protein